MQDQFGTVGLKEVKTSSSGMLQSSMCENEKTSILHTKEDCTYTFSKLPSQIFNDAKDRLPEIFSFRQMIVKRLLFHFPSIFLFFSHVPFFLINNTVAPSVAQMVVHSTIYFCMVIKTLFSYKKVIWTEYRRSDESRVK